jgi:hypothetical protein
MTGTFKAVLTALAVVVLATALLVPVAGASTASGMMGTPSPSPSPSSTTPPGRAADSWCGGGVWNGDGSWGGTGMWGTGSGMSWLTSNPDALAAWTQLRADHQQAMQAWYDTYKADLTAPEAQQALHDLWAKDWNDMKAFYERYANGATWTAPSDGMWGGWDMGGMMGHHDWDAHHMWGTGYGASWMMSHSSGLGQWLAMRGKQTAAVSAWSHRYHNALKSSAAQTTLRTMRTRQRAQVRSFYTHHGLTVTTARMRSGAGGWMGLGGMWGGFGW